ncbi:hypothetical protein J7F01_29530 [Streptomyces sp. ISL-22]|uniref:hypothetical protein n=1 Tax=unclassified Streptomyces TaxID=2593676 RepID=UPI001BEBD801|nr:MULTISPECIES: hypothetical protein [unclassified Streptomyces]MBT2423661.1 hypothetical protein [Streptomyces sp. ISL-24]MBT2436231.1 hypothetical protein [Streptomyces sp. ISL-22]
MSGVGGLDRPGAPAGPGAWDERSQEWLAAETDPWESRADTPPSPGRQPAAPHTTGRRQPPARRTGADPVKALMHRHRDLCARAVDPLEVAVGLEAHGVTDRTAARFLHRDVFSLAEEMYARVPRDAATPSGRPPFTAPRARADWALLTLLPGALCAAAVTGLHLTHGHARLIVAAAGCLAVALALRAAMARGPLAATDRTRPPVTRTCWLIAYALLGDGLLSAAATGGPDALPTGTTDGPWPLATTPVLALALSCAPAAWCTHLLAVRARRKLSASRALEDFATSARPLLLGTFTLYVCALTALLTLTATALDEPAAHPQTLTLGALLLLSRLLTTHGFTHAPALVLTATATAEATALCTLFASRIPGCAWLATPVQALIDTWGPGSIPTAACGAGALTLLLHATRTLTRASAYARQDQPW